MFLDDLRPDVSISRDELVNLPWEGQSACELAVRRSITQGGTERVVYRNRRYFSPVREPVRHSHSIGRSVVIVGRVADTRGYVATGKDLLRWKEPILRAMFSDGFTIRAIPNR